ncbi:ATP phosphoribosyltransferase regulatory subunit [Chitinilyticum piscinae]|uniref:ATP phosphoribosyltransferase regulatory subunit n=1 Tax=Chitinilyticum piscinae TaxID=2866724 RepID=A0A8J7FMZ3_9NEIS|nr:ATP phosphoribosyltransferase regulatory subunit [Chitinilyticum piscinae]MBE9609586.1 ATP phosphoribosyltransferase regulatory subunit [Chitinilyticum piscinae]
MRNWILPEYISDVLPSEARQIEAMRRNLLDLFARYGYELVQPPLVEYVESLFTQDDRALDLKTFKLVDELTGRQMGLRADITPQVARIDAHLLNRQGATRLCYAGSVVTTRPDGILATREPRQIGAELYGVPGIAADVEIIELMVESLSLAGVKDIRLEIGHIGLFLALADAAGLQGELREQVFVALQQKDLPGLIELTAALPQDAAQGLQALARCYGGSDVLAKARAALPALPAVSAALDTLVALQSALQVRGIAVGFDLSELHSSYYHTGLVFNAYTPGFANAVARGGRYDSVGEKFGRSRPATGFSLDVRALTQLPFPQGKPGILAPQGDEAGLVAAIRALRAAGETVIVDLGVVDGEVAYDRRLAEQGGQWQVVAA